MTPRLWFALAAYALLALLAAMTLEKVFRSVVWLALGALAVRTWIAVRREGQP